MPDLLTLFAVLVRFETGLWNAVDARLRTECELPLSWFAPLRVVAGLGSCRVRDIADELAITVGATSKRVDRLEAAALCHRRAHPTDGRSSIIELTPAGTRLLARADAVFEDELRTQLGPALISAVRGSPPAQGPAPPDPRRTSDETIERTV